MTITHVTQSSIDYGRRLSHITQRDKDRANLLMQTIEIPIRYLQVMEAIGRGDDKFCDENFINVKAILSSLERKAC